MSRTLAYPILAVAVVAMTALGNLAVFQAGEEWFVLRPSFDLVIRNVAVVACLVIALPLLLPSTHRTRSGLAFVLAAAMLVGVGSAMQFRLGHDVPRKLSRSEVAHIMDSVSASLPGAPLDSVRRQGWYAVRRLNARLRTEFESARIDTRLARSLERAYGPVPITREVLDARSLAPSDNLLLRILPALVAIILVVVGTRLNIVAILARRWVVIGVAGSLAVALGAFIYLKMTGGIRSALVAPQELLKLTLPIAWGGLLVRYHDALMPRRREAFTRNPFVLWLYILVLLSAPMASFILARDFGQFLVIGLAQVLLLGWYTRSPLYVVLFSAAFIASGLVLVSAALPAGVSLGGALGVMAGAVVALAWLERFRRRDVLWTSASLVLAGYLALAAIASRLPFMASLLATPRVRFALFADLYSRNGDAGWWDRTRQVIESLYAQDAGGFLGRGLGLGTPFLIPNANSDYIFSAIVEELGIAGGAMLIIVFASLVAMGLRIASDIGRESFAGLIVAGMTLTLGAQGVVHIGGNLNVLPMTGITLPFVSAGGSSMVVTMAMMAMTVILAGGIRAPAIVIRSPTSSS